MTDIKLYIIDYESSQWCGGQSHCLVYARDETEAEGLSEYFMDDAMRELFSTEYDEDINEGGGLR